MKNKSSKMEYFCQFGATNEVLFIEFFKIIYSEQSSYYCPATKYFLMWEVYQNASVVK